MQMHNDGIFASAGSEGPDIPFGSTGFWIDCALCLGLVVRRILPILLFLISRT